jgi:hypothetical protein
MTTILYDERVSDVAAHAEGEHLWLAPDALEQATGWKLEPQGLCRGDACVQARDEWRDDAGRVDLAAFASHLGQPIIRDGDAIAFGESVATRRDALLSTLAPDFTLPDLDGRMHSLSDYRGKKVFLYSWGSY